MISDATVTAITGKRLSHENVSPLRKDTAKTSAQLELVADETLFVRHSFIEALYVLGVSYLEPRIGLNVRRQFLHELALAAPLVAPQGDRLQPRPHISPNMEIKLEFVAV